MDESLRQAKRKNQLTNHNNVFEKEDRNLMQKLNYSSSSLSVNDISYQETEGRASQVKRESRSLLDFTKELEIQSIE